MDYDRGLNMLKDFIETGNTNSSLEFKGQKKLYPLQYVGLKRICPINEIGQNMEQDFTYLLDFLRENYSDQLKGKPMSIYHQWKINKNRVSYTACHPITEIPTTLPKPFFTRKIPQTKVYTVRHIGPYRHIGNAWATAMVHQRAKLFKPRKGIPPMEVMINSPKETPENELIAEVLFPMK
jgi:effector-binding domain-containing protein